MGGPDPFTRCGAGIHVIPGRCLWIILPLQNADFSMSCMWGNFSFYMNILDVMFADLSLLSPWRFLSRAGAQPAVELKPAVPSGPLGF